jgi:ribosomal protein S8
MLDFAKGMFDVTGCPIYIPITRSTVSVIDYPAAVAAIKTIESAIVSEIVPWLISQGYISTWTDQDKNYTSRDTLTLLRALEQTLSSGDEMPMLNFAKGLFTPTGTLVISSGKLYATQKAFEYIRDRVKSVISNNNALNLVDALFQALITTLNSNTSTAIAPYLYSFTYIRDQVNNNISSAATRGNVTILIANLISNITNPTVIQEPSRITAIGHTWTAVMAGVALTKIPPANNNGGIQDSIYEGNNAVVIASGQDDQGNALFVGGLQISADTGELGGAPFDQAVRRVATRAAISGSF